MYHLLPTTWLKTDKVAMQLADTCQRHMTGLPVCGKQRHKEQCALDGTLKCGICGTKSGTRYGETGDTRFNVYHFDVDGMTDEHLKRRTQASSRVGVTERELGSAVAQWLCKLCHATKPNSKNK
ncbi:hypothetical protein TrCOL_g5632 [Triparma columacea]|uniref:Uncharacterized protein n=1 Tax=Triparma columacea TaxID=722753 RepID=A0A9W7GNG6_9STRA|nr:hypothetical protein TrCOL_g5632 [Triparma columacea]